MIKQDTVQKIESTQKGQSPAGCCNTQPNIPQEWKIKKLTEICPLQRGYDLPSVRLKQGPYPVCYSNGVLNYHNTYKAKGPCVVTGRSGTIGKVFFIKEDCWPHNTTLWVTDFKGNDPLFIYHFLSNIELEKFDAGTSIPTLNRNDLHRLSFPVPTLPEQKKIAALLSVAEHEIKLQQQLLEEKRKQKRWLMLNLLPQGSGAPKAPSKRGVPLSLHKVRLGDCIEEVNVRTTVNNQYEILSVTRNGIVSQDSHFNKQIASRENIGYKIVQRGDLVFSTMNLWMGSLDVVDDYDFGIVSPAYKTFFFKEAVMLREFGKYYLKSGYMIWQYRMNSEQGASVVRRNLDLAALLNTYISLPSLEEQGRIASILSTADREIFLWQQRYQQSCLRKKKLTQMLMSGKLRV